MNIKKNKSMKYWKLGCRWGSKKHGLPLFLDLLINHKIVISWIDKDFKKGNTILLTDGFTPLAIAITKSERKPIIELNHIKHLFEEKRIDFDDKLFYYNADIFLIKTPDFKYEYQVGISQIHDKKIISKINIHLTQIQFKKKMENVISIIKQKKQIILQGPPGTGKTRLAKQIANEITDNNQFILTPKLIKKNIVVGNKIAKASGGKDYFTVLKIGDDFVEIQSERSKPWRSSFSKIIERYNELSNEIKPSNTGGTDPYDIAVANYLYKIIKPSKVENAQNYKIIQFHPSYTYEDFVRGITVKSGENSLEYITENKVFAKIAYEAQQNYLDSKKKSSDITYEKWLEEQLELFKELIEDEIDNEGKYLLTDKVGIEVIGERYFKFVGNGWHDYIKYSSFLDIIKHKIFDRKGIKKHLNINSRATYYTKLTEKFNAFLEHKQKPTSSEKEPLKNYVLIIDEINRANLSSVLGELIYALEYRGEPVESMYELEDGGNTIILPENLYIIGTMNTADRSVGQIDYAIRRRFAFVDVLPEALDENTLKGGLKFNTVKFNEVKSLFEKHITDEFNIKDVQLGHSYFIHKEGDFNLKLEYEIKPILNEYVADGILKESALELIKNL